LEFVQGGGATLCARKKDFMRAINLLKSGEHKAGSGTLSPSPSDTCASSLLLMSNTKVRKDSAILIELSS
jgi:hypothetical protein